MEYKAVVVGATGLVGRYLVQELIKDENCLEIRVLVRKETGLQDSKIKELLMDFDNEEAYLQNIKGDVLFSCLGTTLRQAGSQQNQYKVDFGYQYLASSAARNNGIEKYVLVSSPFAKIDSGNYYRKMKAELEEAVGRLAFKKMVIIKPNGLLGPRKAGRKWEEKMGAMFTPLFAGIPFLRKYKPIHGQVVAQSMLRAFYNSFSQKENVRVLERCEVEREIY